MICEIFSILFFGLLLLTKPSISTSLEEYSAEWVPICSGCSSTKVTISKGITYSKSQTNFEETVKSLDSSVSAGFKFLGIGTSVEISASIGKTTSEEISTDYVEEKEEIIEIECDHNLYQFEIFSDNILLKWSNTICAESTPECVPGQCEKNTAGKYVMPAAKLIDIYRYYNGGNGDHMCSSSPNEESALKNGYGFEQNLFKLKDREEANTRPLYRLYNQKNDHMISSTKTEAYNQGYRYEMILGFCSTVPTSKPIYRQYAATKQGIDHLTSIHSTGETTSYSVEFTGCYAW